MKKFVQQLSVLISDCQLYILSLSTDLVSALEKIEVVVNQCFSQLLDVRADEFFARLSNQAIVQSVESHLPNLRN